MPRSPRCALFLALIALLFMVGCTSTDAAAQRQYAGNLRKQLETDQNRLKQLFERINSAAVESAADVQSLSQALQNSAGEFDQSTKAYLAMPAAPSEPLAESTRLGAGAAKTVVAGAQLASSALRQGNAGDVRNGFAQVNEGAAQLSRAIDKFNGSAGTVGGAQGRDGVFQNLAETPIRLTLLVGGPILAALAYLLAAGYLLNSLFRRRLTALVIGTTAQQPSRRDAMAAAYGAHLVLLIAVAYALLVFSLVLVLDFGLASAWLIVQLPRIPIVLPIAVLAVLVLSVVAILRALFSSPRTGSFGVSVDDASEPELWAMSRATAAGVATRVADSIIVSPWPGISVHEEGGLLALLSGRTRRVLTLGAPSLAGLTLGQLRAILGHEYAHFSNHDTSWASLTFRAGSAISETVRMMRSSSGSGFWFTLVSLLNPAPWCLLAYQWLFAYFTSGFSRMCEVFADQTAVGLYGSAQFSSALLAVSTNDGLFHSVFLPRMHELAGDGKAFANVYEALEQSKKEAAPEQLAAVARHAMERGASAFDQHPLLRERLAYSEQFNISRPDDENRLATDLFQDWNALSGHLSDLLSHIFFASVKPSEEAATKQPGSES